MSDSWQEKMHLVEEVDCKTPKLPEEEEENADKETAAVKDSGSMRMAPALWAAVWLA